MNYRDLIIEGLPATDDYHSPPALPDGYAREYIGSIPSISLPNGRFVFYIRVFTGTADRLEADPRVQGQIIARSWQELFFGDYRYWDWVFDAEVTELIDGLSCRARRKVALVSDQDIHGIYVPCIFGGDEVPDFPVPRFVVEKSRRFRADTRLILPSLVTLNSELVRRVRKNPDELHQIRPRQFEELICEVLARYGWRIELTPASKDGGYDIVGISGAAGGVASSWLIECKKYGPENKVGVGVVRALCGVKEQVKVANAMIVTTSTFTSGAVEMGTSRWDLSLRDHEDVLDWVSRVPD
ncbi:MAG: restriction endonuclease [Burkholderiaceae bacterium]